MIAAIRKSPTGLTLLCLAGVTTTLSLCIALLIAANAGSRGATHSSPRDDVATALMLVLAWPLVWWVFAKMAGGLWRMNDDFFWKLMMCTGALALVLAALSCDLVVITIVRRLYTGEKDLKGCILNVLPIENRVRTSHA